MYTGSPFGNLKSVTAWVTFSFISFSYLTVFDWCIHNVSPSYLAEPGPPFFPCGGPGT
ncbi:MAG: hypothetical protein RUMPE_00940 [Eubacteriales bacterium SKADARSKE-1]|nr:hypothetical protein [Eubacteriales bacterium SKADARSKE-1]